MTISIRASARRTEGLKSYLQRTLDRLEEEELVIERNPELISLAMVRSERYRDEAAS